MPPWAEPRGHEALRTAPAAGHGGDAGVVSTVPLRRPVPRGAPTGGASSALPLQPSYVPYRRGVRRNPALHTRGVGDPPEISKRTHPFHPHINIDGSICTFFVPDRTWDPVRDDLSRLVNLAGDWLRRFTFYESARWWPGAEAPHEAADVLAEMKGRPNAPCVCGSGEPFGVCCLGLYRGIARMLSGPGVRARNGSSPLEQRAVQHDLRRLRHRVGARGLAGILPDRGPPAWTL